MPLVATAVARAVDASNVPLACTISGIADEILRCADVVRVNRRIAAALAERTRSMSATIQTISQDIALDDGLVTAIDNFQQSLNQALQALSAQGKKSYLSQLLLQQSNKDRLMEISDNLDCAFDIIMTRFRMSTANSATALTSRLQSLLDSPMPEPRLTLAEQDSDRRPTFAAIPPNPSLLLGRDTEMRLIAASLTSRLPDHCAGRVAILGGPGMGKTTLAVAVLHEPLVRELFGSRRFFVPCDAADNGQLRPLSVISKAFGIIAARPEQTKQELQEFIGSDPTLIVLDNFESIWESSDNRDSAETVLGFLDGFPNLALILTLRGAERPAGMRWTRPFLPALCPLDSVAANQTFSAIANIYDESDDAVEQLLRHADNIPLAVTLIANLAQTESPLSLLRRWDQVKTAMVYRGDGQTRLTSLDVSIQLSLQSPRMQAVPCARTLLRLLSLLPRGIVEADLRLSFMEPAARPLSTLIQTCLASYRPGRRVYVLSPIRNFVLAYDPPEESEVGALYDHYFGIAADALYTGSGCDAGAFIAVEAELANIDSVIQYAFSQPNAVLERALRAVASLCVLYARTGLGTGPDLLPVAVSLAKSRRLDFLYAELLYDWGVLSTNTGIPGDMRGLCSEALAIYKRLGKVEGIVKSSIGLLRSLPPKNAVVEAQRLCTFATSLSSDLPARWHRQAVIELAVAFDRDGQFTEAIGQWRRVIQLGADKRGDVSALSFARIMIGQNYTLLGELGKAENAYDEALAVLHGSHSVHEINLAYYYLGTLRLLQGKPSKAIDYIERALAVARATAFHSYLQCLVTLVQAHQLLADPQAASLAIERLDHLRQRLPSALVECRCMWLRGREALLAGDLSLAHTFLESGRVLARCKNPALHTEAILEAEADALAALTWADHLAGDQVAASLGAIRCLALYRAVSFTTAPIPALVLLAEVADDSFAEVILRAVFPPLHKMGLGYDMAKALLRSATIAHSRGEHRLAQHRARNALKYFGEVKDTHRLQSALAILDGGDKV